MYRLMDNVTKKKKKIKVKLSNRVVINGIRNIDDSIRLMLLMIHKQTSGKKKIKIKIKEQIGIDGENKTELTNSFTMWSWGRKDRQYYQKNKNNILE